VARPKARSFKLEYKMATKKPMKKPVKRVRRFQEGGETADKMAGLAASNKDAPMGFFERLRMGNIDQEGSEAYNRLGAGRAKMDRDAASEAAANRMVDEARSAKGISNYQQSVDQDEMDRGADMRNYEMMQRGRAEGERDEKRMAPSSVAQAQNAAILAAKPSRTASGKTTGDFTRLDRKALLPSGPNVARDPGGAGKRGAASSATAAADSASAIPGASATQAATAASPERERLPEVTGMSNLEKLLVGTGLGGAAAGMAGLTLKARKAYLAGKAARAGARKRGDLKQQTIDEINQVRKADGRQQITSDAPMKASSDLKRQTIDQINQARKADGRPPLADDAMKRGGRVKKMASGGSVKSSVSAASKRGDGIALRGKTRGKIY
jgi:gas vesicle protein